MKDISEIRRASLRKLRGEFERQFKKLKCNRNKKYSNLVFCQTINISPSTYNQLLNKKLKPIFNERYARNIEQFCLLTHGWFDIDHENLKLEDRKIGYKEFIAAHKALDAFLDLGIIDRDNEELLEKIQINLFVYLSGLSDVKNIKLDKDNFLDFLK
jgi:hypothetical protein